MVDIEMQSVSEKDRQSPDIDGRTQYSNSAHEPNYGDDKDLQQSFGQETEGQTSTNDRHRWLNWYIHLIAIIYFCS
jgi:hypothetical protein